MIYINSFIDKIRIAETRSDGKFVMSLSDAKNLHGDITKLLTALHELSAKTIEDSDKVTKIEIAGGNWE